MIDFKGEYHMKYGGFGRDCPYLNFENLFTERVEKLWDSEIDPEVKEMLRLEILRQRIFSRDYWKKIGKEVPPSYKFSEK